MSRRRGRVRRHVGSPVDLLPHGWLLALMMSRFDDYEDFHGLASEMSEEECRGWVRANVPTVMLNDYCEEFAEWNSQFAR
ncbi:hypothetical protein ACGFKX_15655 [Pseudonocardia alni]|uniref:hypothetical protein n=1 Tax=Pseudonocardia alni TaxID=33907 RepID=UPI00371D7090